MEGSYSASRLPVDRGWSWVIMAGHFVMTLTMAGYGRSLSLFLLEFVPMFGASMTTAVLSYAVMTACFGLGNVLVTHVLLPRFDTRHVIVTGAITGSLAISASCLAPNMTVIIILHCVIGLSHAMMHTSSATLMGPYFSSRRGLANAVSNTGVSVSALLFPPVTQLLMTSYGTRGALLLVGGIQMQAVVAACLMRPVEFYERLTWSAEREKFLERDDYTAEKSDGRKYQIQGCSQSPEAKYTPDKRQQSDRIFPERNQYAESGEDGSVHHDVLLSVSSDQEEAGAVNTDQNNHEDITFFCSESLKLTSDSRLSCLRQDDGSHAVSEKEYFEIKHFLCATEKETKSKVLQSEILETSQKESELREQFDSEGLVTLSHQKKNISHEPTLKLSDNIGCQPVVEISMTSVLTSADDDSKDVKAQNGNNCCSGCKSVTSKLVDLTLLRNWLFVLIVTYVPFGQTNAFLGVFLPALGVDMGLSRVDVALLLTVMGGVDLCSRLLVGYLADTRLVRPTRIVAFCLALLSVSCMFASFYRDFGRLAVFSVMFGLCGGTCQNLLVVVIVELLGLRHLRQALGIVMMVNSLCLSLTHPLLGALVDLTGSFVVTFHYVGGCLLLAVVVLLMEPLARRLQASRIDKTSLPG